MAVMILEALVLRGLPVAGDVLAGKVRLGSTTNPQAPAFLSYPRHLSQGFAEVDKEPSHRPVRVDDADAVGDRAGRPGKPRDARVSRRPAQNAGRAVLSGWPVLARELVASQGFSRQTRGLLRGPLAACLAHTSDQATTQATRGIMPMRSGPYAACR